MCYNSTMVNSPSDGLDEVPEREARILSSDVQVSENGRAVLATYVIDCDPKLSHNRNLYGVGSPLVDKLIELGWVTASGKVQQGVRLHRDSSVLPIPDEGTFRVKVLIKREN